jgi:integrase
MPSINDKFIKSLDNEIGKQKVYYDDKLTGFGIRVNYNSKSFFLRYVINRRERKFTIGNYPIISPLEAREIATKIKGDIIRGIDPLERKAGINRIPLFKDFAEDFLNKKKHELRPKTFESYKKWCLEKHILPTFGNVRIDNIVKKDIEKFHASFFKSKAMGNRVLAVLNSMFNLAVSWEIIKKNPASGIKKFTENKRERYLSEKEIVDIWSLLEQKTDKINGYAIKLILLTGSRKGEVLGARWEDIDLTNKIWFKPAILTKQKKSLHIPLNEEAVEIISNLKKEIVKDEELKNYKDEIVSNSQFLFYNTKTKTHVKDSKTLWRNICIKANVKNARMHDLRHTFASLLVNNGVGLEMIGRLIGHANIKTTQRYAHLTNQSLRKVIDSFKLEDFKTN